MNSITIPLHNGSLTITEKLHVFEYLLANKTHSITTNMYGCTDFVPSLGMLIEALQDAERRLQEKTNGT